MPSARCASVSPSSSSTRLQTACSRRHRARRCRRRSRRPGTTRPRRSARRRGARPRRGRRRRRWAGRRRHTPLTTTSSCGSSPMLSTAKWTAPAATWAASDVDRELVELTATVADALSRVPDGNAFGLDRRTRRPNRSQKQNPNRSQNRRARCGAGLALVARRCGRRRRRRHRMRRARARTRPTRSSSSFFTCISFS